MPKADNANVNMNDSKEAKQLKCIVCQVEKIIFRDGNTGRTIMSVIQNDGKRTRLLGKTSKVDVNYVLKATGSWSKDEKYGWQFNAEFIQVVSADPLTDDSEYRICNVKSVKVIKEETGFSIVSAEDVDANRIKLSGRLAKVRQGATIGVYGNWKHDDKYGDELQVSTWEYTTSNEDNALKLAAEFINSLKPKQDESVEENTCTIDDSTIVKELPTDPTIFSLDSDLAKRADIQSVTISDCVIKIEKETFVGCNSLTEIIVSENNDCYASIDGVLFNKDMTELLCYPSGKVGSYTVPSTVVKISDWAFCGCLGLTTVDIPESVTSIGEYSFAYCSGLESVKFPKSTKEIGKRCFYCCFRLENVYCDENTVFEVNSFEGCSRITGKIIDIDWDNVFFSGQGYWGSWDYYICVFDHTGKQYYIENKSVRPYMNKILRRLTEPLPKLKVRFSFDKTCAPTIADTQILNHVLDLIKENIIIKTEEVEWSKIKFGNGIIKIFDPFGTESEINRYDVDASMNRMLQRLSAMLPKLVVRFVEGQTPVILNTEILDDIIIVIKRIQEYGKKIRSSQNPSDVLKAFNVLSKEGTLMFVPSNKSPYLDFLADHHAIEKYPIIPIEEYNGSSYEEGALFSIIIDGCPHIIWESFNASRSSYVFRCTEENYFEKRECIFSYLITDKSPKRQFLRTNNCKEIFGEKPQMIVHNNFESWAERLMKTDVNAKLDNNKTDSKETYRIANENVDDIRTDYIDEGTKDIESSIEDDYAEYEAEWDFENFALTKEQLSKLNGSVISIQYLIDPETYFYGDEQFDNDGYSTELYFDYDSEARRVLVKDIMLIVEGNRVYMIDTPTIEGVSEDDAFSSYTLSFIDPIGVESLRPICNIEVTTEIKIKDNDLFDGVSHYLVNIFGEAEFSYAIDEAEDIIVRLITADKQVHTVDVALY